MTLEWWNINEIVGFNLKLCNIHNLKNNRVLAANMSGVDGAYHFRS